jgi:hypothetical protein
MTMTSPQKSLEHYTPWSSLLRMLSPESGLSLSAQAASKLSHASNEVNYGRMFNRTNADLDSEPLSPLNASPILPAHGSNDHASSVNNSMLVSSPLGAFSPFSPFSDNWFGQSFWQDDALSISDDLSKGHVVTSSQLDSLAYSKDNGSSATQATQSVCSLPGTREMLSWLSDEDSNIASSASDVTTDEENLDVKPLSTSAIDNHNQQLPAKSALFKRTLDQISTTEEAVSNDDASSTNSSQRSKRTRSECSSFSEMIDSELRHGPCA